MLAAITVTMLLWGSTGRQDSVWPAAPDIEVFVQAGCPHCARARQYLARLQAERPTLRLAFHDVASDHEALARLRALAAARGITRLGVPAFLIRGVLLIGFDETTTGPRIAELVAAAAPSPASPTSPAPAAAPVDAVEAPLVGRLSASELGLPLFTLAVGLLDGFNPCAMWALLYILSLLVNLRSRRRMLLVGGTFVLVAGVLYYAFMAAWLEAFLLIGFSRPIQLALGTLAVGIGVLNAKDFIAFGRGPSLAIPESAKRSLYPRMRRVLTAENLAGALAAVAVLSAMVNLVELLCTAGLPAVYTQVLSSQELSRAGYHLYLGLYTAAYVFDDGLMLGVATITLSRHKLQERGGRWLKLLSGLVMLALGLTLIVRPEWLR